MQQYFTLVKNNWLHALRDRNFAVTFVFNFIICLVIYYVIIYWLHSNASRQGPTINDPLQELFTPRDYSVLIGVLAYGVIVPFLFYIVQYPHLLHRLFRSFTAVFVLRALCIYLLPLSPAPQFIPLYDPFTNYLAGEGSIFNDLFFSGHVADLFIFILVMENNWAKYAAIMAMVAVAFLLCIQRVHYTIDVLAAPFFAYVCHLLFVGNDWRVYKGV